MARVALPADWRSRVVAGGMALAVGKCEDTANRGQVPDFCVRTNGGALGEYWCADAGCTVFHRTLGNASPFLRSGSCEQQRQRALTKGALRARDQFDAMRANDPLSVAGWVALCIGPDEHGRPHAHHWMNVGVIDLATAAIVVTGPRGGFLTIEGNAADPAKPSSRNGDGLYAGRERGHPDDHTEYQFIDPAAL